jgi:hypothetical protein
MCSNSRGLPFAVQEIEAWVQALCDLIPALDKETLKSQVLSLALSKGEMEGNTNARIICARILGAAAPFLVGQESGTITCLCVCFSLAHTLCMHTHVCAHRATMKGTRQCSYT